MINMTWDIDGGLGTGGGGSSGPGGGSGGAGGGGVSTADARSIEFGRLMFIVSAGEIEGLVNGLKSIYLNDTPLQNPDDTFNFKGVAVAWTKGSNTQKPIPGFPAVESEVSVNTKVSISGGSVTRAISTSGLTAVRVTVAVPQLKVINQTDGKEQGTTVRVKIERQRTGYNGGAYEEVTLDQTGNITGKFGSKYTKAFRIELPNTGTGAWNIRVTRITADAPDAYTVNETWWDSYTEITDGRFRYPNWALFALMVDAKQFPNIPSVSLDMDLIKCEVPKNYTPATQDPDTGVWTAATYATTGPGTTGGIWDGTFKTMFTRNPVWQYYTLATNPLYGAGQHITASELDAYTLYAISQTCDDMVDDGRGGQEPRYFCDVHIQSQEDAQTMLDHFASAFRGMSYWAGGKLTAVQDKDEAPVMIFTNANVDEGKFIYQGVGRKARHNAATIQYNEPASGYRVETKYVEDEPAIARYGFNQSKLQAFGTTSQGLAIRFGRWKVYTDLTSYETVSFVTGAEGVFLHAGEVFQVQDNYRAGGNNLGGRTAAGATTTVVPLDRTITLPGGTNYLKCFMPDGTMETKTISTGAGSVSSITVASAFSSAPAAGVVWMVQNGTNAKLYRAVSVKEKGPNKCEVTGLLHIPAKYAAIETGILVVDTDSPGAIAFPQVGSLSASETLRKQNDRIIAVLTAHWLPPTMAAGTAGPMGYIAEASRDSGPWVPMVIDATSAELADVDLGSWRVRVTAVYGNGVSAPSTVTYVVLGKTAPPSDVTSFVAAVTGDLFQATWDPCPDLDFDHSIIKTPSTAGGDTTDALKWQHGTVVEGCDILAVTTVALARPADGSHDYWIKHVDTSGNESANPTKLTLVVNPLDDYVTAPEKRDWQAEYDRLWAEKAGLDARASTAGASATAYDASLTALDSYLNTLTGTGGWTPVAAGTGHWTSSGTNFSTTYYLGSVGSTGAIFYSKFKDVWTARDALVNAILAASLLPNTATDTFRNKLTWDFTDADPKGFVAGSITVAACAAPDDKTARKWTTTGTGILGKFTGNPQLTQDISGTPTAIPFDVAGKDCYIVQARVKLVSGNWAGKCYYSTDGTTFTQNVAITAPTVGAWQIVTWDLRSAGTSITAASSVKGFAFELAGSGTTEIHVDYVSVGVYGHGSAYDSDLALQLALSDLVARGNVTVFQNLVVGNVTNLFPNPNSEILHVAAGGTLPNDAIGAVGVTNTYTGNMYAGVRCREIASTTALTVTPRYGCTAGDAYYLEAQIAGYSPGTPTITIRPYAANGSALTTQTLTGASGGYAKQSMIFTLPAGAYSFDLAMHNAGGNGTSLALFDNIILRKAADGQLIVPGSILTKHLTANCVQAYQLSIGHHLQFKANASGLTLQGRTDGSMSRATSGELTGPPALPGENAADAQVYMDDSRSYPAADVKTFEAQFTGTNEDRGFIINMGSAFATSGQTGLLVIWSGTTLKVCGCTGIGKYPTNTTKTALTNGTATVTATGTGDDKLTAIYYYNLVPPASGGTANIRLRILINGASVLTMTDADLGSYGGNTQAGYAGVYLQGNVRIYVPRFGRGFVTIQDGVITADKLAVDSIIAEKIAAGAVVAGKIQADAIATTNYAQNGSGYPTAGAKLSLDTNPLKVGPSGMRIGPNGYLLDEVVMRSLNVLDGNGQIDSTFRGWYKGNNDTATLSGGPDISVMTLTRRRWDTTNKICRLELSIQPSAANDNLDGMRYAKIALYRQAAAGAAGTQSATAVDTYYVALKDRLYYNATDSNTGNKIPITFETVDSGISSGVPGAVITIYNVHGASDTHCFYTNTGNGDSDGTTLVDNGTSNPWSSGGSGGGSGGGGGGGGGACPGPLVGIGTTRGIVLARDIKVGDEVITLAEANFEPAIAPVTAVEKVFEENRIMLLLEDGRHAVFTSNHRVLRANGQWAEVRNLWAGDELAGVQPGVVASLQRVQGGTVYKITVEGAHTYMTEGFLSHNAKRLD